MDGEFKTPNTGNTNIGRARSERSVVAQIFNLLYRRIAFGRSFDSSNDSFLHHAPQITNLRYSRVQRCATSLVLTPSQNPGYRPLMFPAGQNPKAEHVKFQLRAAGVKLEEFNPLRSGTHSRGYLPHVKREGARYFVTFRLADSLPKEVLLKFQAERAQRLQRFYAQKDSAKKLGTKPPQPEAFDEMERDYFRKLEAYLDKGAGACWLKRPEVADVVAAALKFFDGERYRLDAWVVMPNHVHVVFWPMPNHTLSGVVQSWKRFTAREVNKILSRTGEAFWQPEPYDHWIRKDEEHARCCRYVLNNPVKARLCATPEDWKWSSAWRQPAAK
jgi:REP-associated tyrosine transposase